MHYNEYEVIEMVKKLTIEDARKMFADAGYELLEDTYVNYMTKMRYRCPKHPDKDLSMNLNNLRAGSRCPYCVGRAKHTTEEVRKEFEERGYILVDEYRNNRDKMRYICLKHPNEDLSINYSNFKKGAGCPKCALKRRGEEQRGERNPNWKGGTWELNKLLRSKLDLWKKISLSNTDYCCFITGVSSDKLKIHHTKPFHVIRDEVLAELGLPLHRHICEYTEEQLKAIEKLFIEKHMEVEGIPMLDEVHKKFHEIYGHETTSYDLLDFKYKYFGTVEQPLSTKKILQVLDGTA